MNIKDKNGRIKWSENKHLLYILFSIMKHYMLKNKMTDIPCQVTDKEVIDCAALMSMITNESITAGQIGSQLWLQTDKPIFSKAHFRNVRIAMEVGLLCEENFKEVVLDTRARMERNKTKTITK